MESNISLTDEFPSEVSSSFTVYPTTAIVCLSLLNVVGETFLKRTEDQV